MSLNLIRRSVQQFFNNQDGSFAVQSAMMFSMLAVLGALLVVPLLNKASQEYAQSQSLGIDPITTASTGNRNGRGNTYVIRRSVLSNGEEILCRTPAGKKC